MWNSSISSKSPPPSALMFVSAFPPSSALRPAALIFVSAFPPSSVLHPPPLVRPNGSSSSDGTKWDEITRKRLTPNRRSRPIPRQYAESSDQYRRQPSHVQKTRLLRFFSKSSRARQTDEGFPIQPCVLAPVRRQRNAALYQYDLQKRRAICQKSPEFRLFSSTAGQLCWSYAKICKNEHPNALREAGKPDIHPLGSQTSTPRGSQGLPEGC